MSVIATALKHLVAAGVTGDALVTAVTEIEEALSTVTERNSVTRNVTPDVTPAAIRMRRMRERKSSENNVLDVEKTASVAVTEGVTERNNSVTTDNNNTSLEIGIEEKKDVIVRNVTRKRNSYAQDFEAFWQAFPTDPGMSKSEASKAWEKLTPEDKRAAHDCIPAFRAWVAQQGANYRTVHACRYISQRRFEGFAQQAVKPQEATVGARVYVQTGTDAMDAWDAFYKRTKGKMAPRDQRGGWYFPTEYPSQQEQAA